MTRRLLPYEYQLIKELGISEAEYLEFAQAQFDYSRVPADKLATPQNWEVVAIVLTVVGVLFQVGSALLAPKPELPSQQNQRRRRDQAFAPRFGFNSAQELAKYGDPVNLVYCNVDQNSTGGVRVATSLVWSAVQSFGSSQFMQMMAVIGASNISPDGIALARVAFGQMPIRQFGAQRYWLYLRQNGILRFSDLRRGNGKDPSRNSEPDAIAYAYRASLVGTQRKDGFSQAFSPSTLTRCGVFAPIPINVRYYDRKDKGQATNAELGIELDDRGDYWPSNVLNNSRAVVPVGHRFKMRFKSLASSGASDVRQAASELRRTLVSNIDVASTYKLGSAHLRVVGPVDDLELDNDAINVTFECVQSGICPHEDYATVNFKQNEEEAQDEIIRLDAEIVELNRLLTDTPPILKPGVGGNVNARLNEINSTLDFIEDVRDRRWTVGELETLASDDGGGGDGTVQHFANKVQDARDKRAELQDKIEDELDKPSNKRNRNDIQDWRRKIKDINKRLKNLQAKLDEAIRQYGFDGNKGTTLRQERKALMRRQAKLQEEIAQIYGDANNIDLGATESRNKDGAIKSTASFLNALITKACCVTLSY
jgi:hypothetical protein